MAVNSFVRLNLFDFIAVVAAIVVSIICIKTDVFIQNELPPAYLHSNSYHPIGLSDKHLSMNMSKYFYTPHVLKCIADDLMY